MNPLILLYSKYFLLPKFHFYLTQCFVLILGSPILMPVILQTVILILAWRTLGINFSFGLCRQRCEDNLHESICISSCAQHHPWCSNWGSYWRITSSKGTAYKSVILNIGWVVISSSSMYLIISGGSYGCQNLPIWYGRIEATGVQWPEITGATNILKYTWHPSYWVPYVHGSKEVKTNKHNLTIKHYFKYLYLFIWQ